MYKRAEIVGVVEEFRGMIADVCERAEIAGSVRRGKATVHDAEIVAMQGAPGALWHRLDRLLGNGVIRRADYGGRTRWGTKYRGLMYQGVRIEIFTADADNWGYQYWLRTGPGDGNQYVMEQVWGAAFCFRDGYGWHAERKLHIGEETEMFRLLGMPYLRPEDRTADRYYKLLRRERMAATFTYAAAAAAVEPRIEQKGLWG